MLAAFCVKEVVVTGRIQLNRWLVVAAAVVLFATAAFHATGYASVSNAIVASGAKPALVAAVQALWLMFSLHLIVIGMVVILASGAPGARRVVLACALFPALDTLLLLRFVGLFVGTVALAAAAALLVSGGLIRRGSENPGAERPQHG